MSRLGETEADAGFAFPTGDRLSPWVRMALCFLCGGAAGFTAGLAAMAALSVRYHVTNPADMLTRFGLLATVLTLAPMVGVTLAFVRWVDGRTFASFGLPVTVAALKQLGLGGVAGLAAVGGIFLTLYVAGAATVAGWAPQLFFSSPEGIHRTIPALFLLFGVQSAGEEILVRGYLLRNLLDVASPPVAVAASSVLFGLAHGFNPGAAPMGLVNIILIGVVLALLCLRTGSLWAAVGVHWAWNFGLGGLFSLPVSGLPLAGLAVVRYEALPPWVSGGAFGPEGGLLGTAAILLLGAALPCLFPRRETPAGEESPLRPRLHHDE